MDRLTYINVAGKNYPMSFSLQAMKILAKKSGSVGNAISKITDKELDADTIDMITEVLEMLITQGCAYKNYFEKDLPTKEDDPVIDGKWTPLPKEVLEIGLQLRDMDAVAKAIEECVDTSAWLDLYARKIGIPVCEYRCMPIGELEDLIDLYLASEGLQDVGRVYNSEQYIPDLD